MKYRLFQERALGMLCVVLASIRLGRTRPQNPGPTYFPPLNCSSSSSSSTLTLTSESESESTLEGLTENSAEGKDFRDIDVSEGAHFLSPSWPSSNQSHSFPEVVEYNYSIPESDYFDYYYEEPEETFSESEQVQDGEPLTGYQPPPGLNRVTKLKLIKTPRRKPPEYMLELYDRFSKAAASVTTFTPREKATDGDSSDLRADIVRSFPNLNKEETADVRPEENDIREDQDQQLSGRETRHHTLAFNITSLLTGEEVSRAELRLYTLVEQDRNTYVGEDREVKVYEGLGIRHLPPVASRHVYGHFGGWEAFDVTSVVQVWVKRGQSQAGDGLHVLEVSIDSVFKSGRRGSVTALDIDVDPEHNEGPLLVVFSKDTSHQLQVDLQDLIKHEPQTDEADDYSDLSDVTSSTGETDLNSDQSLTRTRRALSANSQTRELFLPARSESVRPEVPLQRVRRDKRKRNSCRRKTMYVDFQDINWHQWIIAPPGYMAFECVGKCYVPIGAHLSPTKHAIIQTLVHAVHPKRAARACCVPTKLEPISILYLDDNNIITYKYHYDDMVVAECGCR